ncbi:hypothetical protein N5I87_23860 [Ralstonia sp. CHL-2022]|uniref:Uncharacterized protein n=1 Tax=Ralstonia mojiangensis TaxID=2953895 RepID=A0AAE3I7W1_9RALS|nr:hypothetical protein [Ralstonia mojiangensis]MCT7319065.1 hypothetical protein [Ralstonia mojiangensis]
MTSLNYRDWHIETSSNAIGTQTGTYFCEVPKYLMIQQTVEMIHEGFQLTFEAPNQRPIALRQAPMYFGPHRSGTATLQIAGNLECGRDIREQIDEVVLYVQALAACTDAPLLPISIDFRTPDGKVLMVAKRGTIMRGIGFRIEERGTATQKIREDFQYFRNTLQTSPSNNKVALRHYLTGLTLLALEDSVPGLLEAAYMQFYQGIEAVVQTHVLHEAKQRIARLSLPDPLTAQIVCHQVFNVRHKYFGHGSETDFHEIADASAEEAFRVAKQCLVARWLCRVLLDHQTPSKTALVREMRMYLHHTSDVFLGTIREIESTFWIDFGQSVDAKKAACAVFDANGTEVTQSRYQFLTQPLP